jgi:iron complex outermembrane receptor protein
MTRPDYSALAAPVSLSPPPAGATAGSGTGGNADLKPIRSNNLDATLEWYFAPRSLLSAGLFYMDLTSYVGFGQVTKNYLTFSDAAREGVVIPYVLTIPVNRKGSVKGIELHVCRRQGRRRWSAGGHVATYLQPVRLLRG